MVVLPMETPLTELPAAYDYCGFHRKTIARSNKSVIVCIFIVLKLLLICACVCVVYVCGVCVLCVCMCVCVCVVYVCVCCTYVCVWAGVGHCRCEWMVWLWYKHVVYVCGGRVCAGVRVRCGVYV